MSEKAVSEESVSMWAFPSQYAERFEVYLSPAPDLRSALLREDGTGVAIGWDEQVYRIDNDD